MANSLADDYRMAEATTVESTVQTNDERTSANVSGRCLPVRVLLGILAGVLPGKVASSSPCCSLPPSSADADAHALDARTNDRDADHAPLSNLANGLSTRTKYMAMNDTGTTRIVPYSESGRQGRPAAKWLAAAVLLATALSAGGHGGNAPTGSFVVLTDLPASDPYYAAVRRLEELRDAEILRFEAERIGDALPELRDMSPAFVAVVVRPESLDVNLAYTVLELSCRLDDDPFPDFAYGYVTGARAEDAVALVEAGAQARGGSRAPRRLFLFGPSDVNQPDDKTELDWLAGWEGRRLAHEAGSFPAAHLSDLSGRDIIRFWGHGAPDRVDGSMTSAQLDGIRLGPAVVFAGPCFSAVTHRSYQWECGDDAIKSESIMPRASLALSFIAGGAAAYVGALHEDRCASAAREMEYLLSSGETVGTAVRHTYDTVVMANDGGIPAFPRLHADRPPPDEDPVQFQVNRAASRVLLGDPAYRPFAAAAADPVRTTWERTATGLAFTATVVEPRLRAMFTDLFHSELCTCDTPDDVLHFRVELPRDLGRLAEVTHSEGECPLKEVKHGPVVWAEERQRDRRFLHVQIRFTHGSLDKAGLAFRFEVTTDADSTSSSGDHVDRNH